MHHRAFAIRTEQKNSFAVLRILQLLDPEQTDITMEFAERLIGLLIRNEEQLEIQAKAFEQQAADMQRLRAQMANLQASLNFLSGEPGHGLDG